MMTRTIEMAMRPSNVVVVVVVPSPLAGVAGDITLMDLLIITTGARDYQTIEWLNYFMFI